MQKKRPWNNGRFFCVFICNYERVEMSEMRKCVYGGRE